MYVICKRCGNQILVASKPSGSTTLKNVKADPNVNISGGSIGFGPGGSISFGPGGSISFGEPAPSSFVCMHCGHVDTYLASEIKE